MFAFYYIFEVITTVGYGDYCGGTTNEYLFLIFLEFASMSFFSILMGSVGRIASNETIDDMIEEKYDALYMWIKKIEKSNKGKFIQPRLYGDIAQYIEQAF